MNYTLMNVKIAFNYMDKTFGKHYLKRTLDPDYNMHDQFGHLTWGERLATDSSPLDNKYRT